MTQEGGGGPPQPLLQRCKFDPPFLHRVTVRVIGGNDTYASYAPLTCALWAVPVE